MNRLFVPSALTMAALLSGCVVPPPSGPAVMALPPQGKSFDVFQQEDAYCRNSASQQSGGAQAAQAAGNNAVGSAVVGTAVGAGVGALLGAAAGNAGAGAAVGAGAGLMVGGSAGAGQAQYSAREMQMRYDTAYTQCMYAYGNSVQSPPMAYAPAYPAPAAYPYGPYYAPPAVVVGGYWGRPYYRRW